MDTARLKVVVDGAEHAFPAGTTVLQALRSLGVALPTLCHDERLAPVGQCWSCAVEFSPGPGLPFHNRPACREPLREGCTIRSGGAALDGFRRGLLERLADRAVAAEVARFPDKPLHRALREYGVEPCGQEAGPIAVDVSHPHIRVDMNRCIGCRRCARICDEVQGESVWHVLGRGSEVRIATEGDVPLADSPCVGCGACVDTCPTAALTDARAWREPSPTAWTRTVCPYCAVGCELEAGVAEGRIVATRPVLDAPANKGHLCVKGRYALAYVEAPDRVTAPRLRRDGHWHGTDWDEAIAFAAEGLRRIVTAHGPDAVGVLGSARATNEENYLTQKFARVVLGTNNVDCCARVCHTPSAAALKRMLGTGAATNSFDDIEQAACFLVVGANPLENHPVVGARIRQQVRRGARLIVVDPRRTPLAELADVHLALRVGTNVPLLNAMAHVLFAEDLADRDFLAARVDGVEEFAAFVAAWTPERAADICGVAPDAIRAAARLYARTRPAMCLHGLGMTEHVQGTEGVMALIDLVLLAGQIGRPGTGANPLRGQNNVQGAAMMGCDPGILTGSVAVAEARDRFAAAWGVAPPAGRGLNLLGMLDAAREGRLKALYVIGYDILASLARMHETAAALARLELVIVQDLFLNETARAFGHVFLPAVSSFEKDGTFMNSERRVQRVRRALAPRGQALDDATILCRLAAALGHGAQFAYAGPEAVWDEIRAVWPAVAGIGYARLERQGVQWPCPDADHPGTVVLHGERFAHGVRTRLERIEYRPSEERTDADYPFLLTTGRSLYQFNVGTMTGRTPQQALRPTDTLDMHPYDAGQLGLRDGMPVRVESRHGEALLPLRVTDTVTPGQLFATFHDPERALNRVTGPARDALTAAPEYKVTAVRVSPV
ncbi:formate dehydrogenase subunit alpha [Vulcaniibacterium gelatinicum]|uniref:formate dehydrogenase subunit alpha n=1 Tax=Vulcaniibacterium gelatinicum TaxID=2598725 RepID=UPI0011CBCC10|nr:formate dehydrogenase subunit alpha [Vulcaniibacterium gelatinicum]